MKNIQSESLSQLFRAIALLKTEEEVSAFFEDLCTIKELLDMAQRLEAAKMLSQGVNYLTIAKEVGISTATISRVSKCINYGSGGYEKVLALLEEAESKTASQNA